MASPTDSITCTNRYSVEAPKPNQHSAVGPVHRHSSKAQVVYDQARGRYLESYPCKTIPLEYNKEQYKFFKVHFFSYTSIGGR